MNDMERFRYDDYAKLIGAVIRSGLDREGPDYLLTPGGRYWCELGNLDLEALMRRAVKYAGRSASNTLRSGGPLTQEPGPEFATDTATIEVRYDVRRCQ